MEIGKLIRPAVVALVPALLAVASCTAEDSPGAGTLSRSAVGFAVSPAPSGAGDAGDGGTVGSLDLLAFRASDGRLDAYARSAGPDRVSAVLTAGVPLRWYVVANAPAGALSDYADEASFLAGRTSLGECAPLLAMHASGSLTVSPGGEDVPAALDRYACGVTVGEVAVEWLSSPGAPSSVSVRRVALVNAVTDQPWSAEPSADGGWRNRMAVEDASDPVAGLLCVEAGIPVPDASPVAVDASLLCMPNPTDSGADSSTDPEWCPRDTRVAVELLVDGVPNWYAVDLPAMRGNVRYVVRRLTVLGPGAAGPDLPVSRAGVEFDVTVEEWGRGETAVDFGH